MTEVVSIISIDAPHFCAGVIVQDNVVIDAAPIVNYMRGWSVFQVKAYCTKKQWKYINGG